VATDGFTVRGWVRARSLSTSFVLACAMLVAGLACADVIVPVGSLASLGPGVVDLGCTDVVVSGTLQVNSGQLKNVRSVTINPGGAIDGGSGLIEVGGNWTNSGTFIAGSGAVNFRDLCSFGNAVVMGSTTFSRVSFATGSGKNYVFAVGSTQTVKSLLQITGTAPQPIQFRSSLPGQVAFMDLLIGGTQQIQHVGVTDVWATGQWLAPFLTNEGGGGNARRWFGVPNDAVVPIPTLHRTAILALAALLAVMAAWFLNRRGAIRRSNQKR
jgi:hypothetical protein